MAATPPNAATAAPTLPKVLRLGIVQEGKIVQERLIKSGETVTVGESPKNTFVLPPTTLPNRYPLFVAKGTSYTLQVIEPMEGRISYKNEILALEQIRERQDIPKKSGSWQLDLQDENRGRIDIGPVTILFQFVPAPPEPLMSLEKMDFRPRIIDEVDPVFLGFFSLFSVLGLMLGIYAVNAPPRPEMSPQDIPDRFAQVLIPPSEPADIPPPTESLEADKAKAKTEEKVENEDPAKGERNKSEPRTSEQRKSEAINNSKLLQALIIGTRGANNSGQTILDGLGEGAQITDDIQSALSDAGGVRVASNNDLTGRTGSGGSTGDIGIGDLKGPNGVPNGTGVGGGVKINPTVKNQKIEIDDSSASPEAAATVSSVIKRYNSQIKACYDSRLKEDPSIQGRVAVFIQISGGKVTAASVVENGTGDAALATCIEARVNSWRGFDPSLDTGVTYPFVLAK